MALSSDDARFRGPEVFGTAVDAADGFRVPRSRRELLEREIFGYEQAIDVHLQAASWSRQLPPSPVREERVRSAMGRATKARRFLDRALGELADLDE